MDLTVTSDFKTDMQGYTEEQNLTAPTDAPVIPSSKATNDFKNVEVTFNVVGFIFTPTHLIVWIFGRCMTIITLSPISFSDLTSIFTLIALDDMDAVFWTICSICVSL